MMDGSAGAVAWSGVCVGGVDGAGTLYRPSGVHYAMCVGRELSTRAITELLWLWTGLARTAERCTFLVPPTTVCTTLRSRASSPYVTPIVTIAAPPTVVDCDEGGSRRSTRQTQTLPHSDNLHPHYPDTRSHNPPPLYTLSPTCPRPQLWTCVT